ncbi:MAG: insulinase family protein [Vicinamibacterales bacterium]
MRHRLTSLLLPTLLTSASVTGLYAQAAAPATPSLAPSEPVPFDTAVKLETLPNGLKYYIRKNGRPEKRVMLQLAVKAGSIDEADDQQGLAHFLEHMAFNGTKRFKPGELIAALESSGARMGPHVNAYTSFDETVYMFQLPTDKPGVVEKGVQALADFAGAMTLDPKEIDKERGVVIEEWRGGLGAGSRLRDQQIPVLYYKSKYAERLPIGKPEVLKSFKPERLREFYSTWYRPDRMAVIAVGDIDPSQIETLIKTEFGTLPKPSAPARDRIYEVPLHEDTLVKVATDPEAQQSSVSIVRKRPRGAQGSVGDYRRDVVHRLAFQMMNERFDELSRKPDAQFLGAGAYESGLSPTTGTVGLGASVQEGKIQPGLSALVIEANRVIKHGFGPAEFDRAKKWMLASYERAYAERDKTESGSYTQEYVNHFLEEEPSPGIEYEMKLLKALLPGISAEEVTTAARQMFDDRSRVILAISPQKAGLTIPAEPDLRATVQKAEAVAVTAWNDSAGAAELMANAPVPGGVASRNEMPDLGVTVVKFNNGVEAWLKPTDFKNDQVVFSFVSSGGSSLALPAIYTEATLAPAHVELSGAGGHKAVDLQKILAGKLASASPFVSPSSHGISGSSTPANLETALQLLNLEFTAPGDDPEAFALIKKQLEAAYLNRDRNPNLLFGEKLAQVNTSGHYTSQPLTLDRIAKLDRDAVVRFYRERFANAADFTFVMVGAFKVDETVPLIAKYVGSLPTKGTATSKFHDMEIHFPTAVERAKVEKGREPRSQTVLSFAADPPLEENEQSRVDAATEVLEIALRDILREELGETYSVSVGLIQPLPQRGAGRISISFGSAPDKGDTMVQRILQEVQRLQKEGPSADLVNRAKEAAHREHETARKQNGFWLARLQSAKLLGRDPKLILTREERINAITQENIHEMFKKYFPMDRYTVVTLLPEPK